MKLKKKVAATRTNHSNPEGDATPIIEETIEKEKNSVNGGPLRSGRNQRLEAKVRRLIGVSFFSGHARVRY